MQELFKNLPKNIQKLAPNPNFNTPNFNSLFSDHPENVANSVKTHTLLSLLQPVKIHQPQPIINNKPIILVFCQPSEEVCIEQQDKIFPYAPISYASWLEGAGARCVPLPYNTNEGTMQFLLQRSHGIVLPGGGSNLYKNFFKKEGQGPVMNGFLKVLRYIQKMWSKGINYGVWGTCLGFEMMVIGLSNDTKILSNLNSRGHQLEIYSDYENSRFLKKMPVDLKIKAENYKLVNFQHSFGISVKKYLNSPKLQQKLKISQISKDKDGKWFCSGLEGRNTPMFLSQYHPEKQAYQWTKNGDIVHTQDSIEISQYYVSSFLNECRKCKAVKQFGSPIEQSFYLIQNYRQIHTPHKMYKVYAIDFKYREHDKETRKEMKSQRSISTTNNVKNIKQPFI